MRRLALLLAAILVMAAGCGSDDSDSLPATGKSEYADQTIYFQQVVYNDVTYTCLLAGYADKPGLWCERTPESEINR